MTSHMAIPQLRTSLIVFLLTAFSPWVDGFSAHSVYSQPRTKAGTPSAAVTEVSKAFERQYRIGDFNSQIRAYKSRKLRAARYARLFDPKQLGTEELLSLADLYTYAEQYARAETVLKTYVVDTEAKQITRARRSLLAILIARNEFDEAFNTAERLLHDPNCDRESFVAIQNLIDSLRDRDAKNAASLAENMLPKVFELITPTNQAPFNELAPMVETSFENGLIYRTLGNEEAAQRYWSTFLVKFNASPIATDPKIRKLIEFAARRATLVGQPAPEIVGSSYIDMPPLHWSSLRGKVIMLDYLAPWCVQCINDLPRIDLLHSRYGAKGLVVIGVTELYGYAGAQTGLSAAQELAALQRFKTKKRIKIGFLIGGRANRDSYGVSGYPAVCIIDRAGKIRYLRQGADYRHEVEGTVHKLMSEN